MRRGDLGEQSDVLINDAQLIKVCATILWLTKFNKTALSKIFRLIIFIILLKTFSRFCFGKLSAVNIKSVFIKWKLNFRKNHSLRPSVKLKEASIGLIYFD